MRIITEGRKVFAPVIFDCKACGCVFEARRTEYKRFPVYEMGRMIIVVESKCPNKDCGAFVQATVEEEENG